MDVLHQAIVDATNSVLGEFDHLPDTAVTEGQKVLQAKHGSPREFSKAACKTLGECSVDEVRKSIIEYLTEWSRA